MGKEGRSGRKRLDDGAEERSREREDEAPRGRGGMEKGCEPLEHTGPTIKDLAEARAWRPHKEERVPVSKHRREAMYLPKSFFFMYRQRPPWRALGPPRRMIAYLCQAC